MSDINDGGPAFPALEPHYMIDGPKQHYTSGGMTLRDYLAAHALGAKTVSGLVGYEDHAPEHRAELIRRIARDCYEIADAMLKARAA